MVKRGDKLLEKAEDLRRQGQYDVAAETYQEAAALFKDDQNFAQQADALTALGELYEKLLSDYQRALENYQQSLRVRQIYGLKHLSQEYFNVAGQQNYLGLLADAKDNLERAKNSAKREGDQRAMIKALNLLGDILVEEGFLDEAEEHLRTSLELVTEIGDDLLIANVQGSIAVLLACRNRSEEALNACQGALEHAEKAANAEAVGKACLRFGQILWLSGDQQGARDHLQQALEMAQRSSARILQETAQDWLNRCQTAGP